MQRDLGGVFGHAGGLGRFGEAPALELDAVDQRIEMMCKFG